MATPAAADYAAYTQEERTAVRDVTLYKIDKLVAQASPLTAIEAMDEFSDHEEAAVQAVSKRLTKLGIQIRVTPEMSEIIQHTIDDSRPRLLERAFERVAGANVASGCLPDGGVVARQHVPF